MRTIRSLTVCAVVSTLLIGGAYAKKKNSSEGPPPTNVVESKKKKKSNEEPPTQVLPLPKEPPSAVTGDADHLVFHVTPLSSKGLLSQQTREALRNLHAMVKSATMVRLRAFVAGSGDLRRVQTIVSETFSDKKLPLPVMSVIQVGALPLEGAQIVIEATSLDKRVHNEHGLALISGQPAKLSDATAPVRRALETAHLEPASVRRVTCYISDIAAAPQVQSEVTKAFPEAVSTVVQLQRLPVNDVAECEAVAALSADPEKPLETLGSMALVGPGKLAFTGVQLAFKNDEGDIRIAFQRTDKALETVGTTLKRTAMAHFYPLTRSIGETGLKVENEFCDAKMLPARTSVVLEGLPAQEALWGLDVIAVP